MPIVEENLVQAYILQDYFVDKDTSEALTAGIVTLYKDNDRQVLKNWYYLDGTYGDYKFKALPNPLTLSSIGTIVDDNGNNVIPFYYPFAEDSPSTPEAYYITIDSSSGQRQFTVQNFPAVPDERQDSVVANYQNLIINNRFWRNITKTKGNKQPQSTDLTNQTNLVVCPSAHDGFNEPDMRFKKAITGGVDTLTFKQFESGADSFQGGARPEYYLNHICTTQTANDSNKYYQIPISLHLKTLDDIDASLTIWARSGNVNVNNKITLAIYKFLGSDVGTSTAITIPDSQLTLSTEWRKFHRTFKFPSTSGLDLPSNTGDDAYFLRIELPEELDFNIDFCLPSLYLSDDVPTNEFQTYDQIDPFINGFRTGDVRSSLNFQGEGWVSANGGTIGNFASNGTARNNVDTWPLFRDLYLKVPDLYAPVSGGRAGSTETDAKNDFIANKKMTLPLSLAQVLMGSSPTFETDIEFTVNITTSASTTINTGARTESVTFTDIGDLLKGDIAQVDTTMYGLTANTNYFVRVIAANELAFYESLFNATTDNDRIVITGPYSSAINLRNTDLSITLSSAPSQTLLTGTPIIFNQVGTLPNNLSTAEIYYISSRSTSLTKYKISRSYENAVNGYSVNFYTLGTGANTLQSSIGASTGESDHQLTVAELAEHTHTFTADQEYFEFLGAGPPPALGGPTVTYNNTKPSGTTDATGKNAVHNNIQRSAFVNMFIKL